MTRQRILAIGSGGREHALAWALARSEQFAQVYVAPGNAGTAWAEHTGPDGMRLAPAANVPIPVGDIPALIRFAQENSIALTVVGPEMPLAAGLVDAFQAAGLRAFGPVQNAARLEFSKAFAKEFMRDHGIPTAKFAIFDDAESASRYIHQIGGP